MTNRTLIALVLALGLAGTTAYAHLGAERTTTHHAFDPLACGGGTFDIYFKPADAVLSLEAEAQIEAVRSAMSGCAIEEISILGLADGTEDAQEVSRARADAIADTLRARGIPREKLRIIAGTEEALGGTDSLMPRRARVTIQASLRPAGA